MIIGPPGTGKSQTIANLIAQCLAVRKTVLFVAEKTAALDVVYRRLKANGLGDCCLELHSNKAERRCFLDQLEASWKHRGKEDESDWVAVSEQLRVRRDQLNAYAAAVHMPDENGWTAYRAMGECVRGRHITTPQLEWPTSRRHSRSDYANLYGAIGDLATTYKSFAPGRTPLRVESTEWSMGWENSLLEACQALSLASKSLAASIHALATVIQAPSLRDVSSTQLTQLVRLAQELARAALPSSKLLTHTTLDQLPTLLDMRIKLLRLSSDANSALEAALSGLCRVLGDPEPGDIHEVKKRKLYRLANELVRAKLPPAELVFHPNFDALEELLRARPSLIAARVDAFEGLKSRSFSSALIDRIQVDDLENDWSRANSTVWPLSWLRKRAVARKIKAYMAATATAAPHVDLPLLQEYRDACGQLRKNLDSLNLSPHLRGLIEKDAGALAPFLEPARHLREAIQRAGFSLESVAREFQGSLETVLATARRLYGPGKEVESLRTKLKDNLAELGLSAELAARVESDPTSLDGEIKAARVVREALTSLGVAPSDLNAAVQALASSTSESRRQVAVDCRQAAKSFLETWTEYTRVALATPAATESLTIVADAANCANEVMTRRTALKQLVSWVAIRKRCERLGLSKFVEAMLTGELPADQAASAFQLAYARWWLPTVVDRQKPLRAFQKFLHEGAIDDFRRLDDIARRAAAPRARHAVLHGLPPSDQVPRKSELGLLRHQMSLKRPSKSIRECISGIPDSFSKLAPCLLMSPLSIAQYLPADQAQFDVVVFDEASQIATWDAIGAIARGRQTIIVGDPKQLPPTNFFGRTDNDEDNAELEDYEKDLESILDEAQASGLPTLQLNWHYRSKHESLIAFSNWNYYRNHLVTFPAAESADRGVSLKHVNGALYDRGKSRTNRQEAEAIVADAIAKMFRCLAKPEAERLTYGVVTFNSQQQELIQDLFDEAQRKHPALEWFFSEERIEPTVVKNLENVQGDERDVMMFSITFGYDAAGKFTADFGAINRDGGERRLNVAVTRARHELVVYTSFLPDQLRAERSSARGVRDLKAFLEYAQKGPQAILARNDGSLGGYESPLEEAVAAALEEKGWRVDPQVGVSGFRVDLGVVHPDRPGAYLAGVECDGATYHRSAVARDRDKIRQQVLENLGWAIVRVWSSDWWYDPEGAIQDMHQRLSQLLESSREKAVSDERVTLPQSCGATAVCESMEVAPSVGKRTVDEDVEHFSTELDLRPKLVARNPVLQSERRTYPRFDLGDASANQHRFFDDDYSPTLRAMAHSLLQSHTPIRDDALVRELARAHGFARTGTRIKERVLELLTDVVASEESVGKFLWSGDTAAEVVPFRYARDDGGRRSLDDVPMEELLGLVKEHPSLLASEDPALALAREIGLARLARGARSRLEEAIAVATSHQDV